MRASPALRGLAPATLRLLSAAGERRDVAAATELGIASSPCLVLVLAGEVSVWTRPDPDGISELVGQEGPGAVFGSAAISGDDETPIYRAAAPVQILVWSEAALERVFARTEGLREQLAVRLSLRRREHELVDLLRRTPLFQHVSQSLIRWLVRSCTLEAFAAGAHVCRQGYGGDAMFLVIAGEIAIAHDGDGDGDGGNDDAPRPLARLHRGDFFGELALVQRSTRTASATALSDAEILVVGRAAFETLDERSSAFHHAVRLTAQRRLDNRDGAVRHNVPASTCIDAGADFVIACDVVPLPGVPRGRRRRGLTGMVLDVTQLNRVSDAVRSLYWLTSDSGQRQASVADAIFSPDLAEFDPWDFPSARAIVARAETELEGWMPATAARYRALAEHAGAAHG